MKIIAGFDDFKYPNIKSYFEEMKLTYANVYFITAEEACEWNISKEKFIIRNSFSFSKENCEQKLVFFQDNLKEGNFEIICLELRNQDGRLFFTKIAPEILRFTDSNTLLRLIDENLATREKFTAENYKLNLVLNTYSVDELKEISKIPDLDYNQWNFIGNSYRHHQEFELAENAYQKSIELNPVNAEPYSNLLSLYISFKKYDNYENIYSSGMANAYPKYQIIYQDGRYQYLEEDYDMAYSAALSVLTAKQMEDEGAWILGVMSLLKMSENETDITQKAEYYMEAKEMLSKGLVVYRDSNDLKELKEIFEDE